MLPFSAQVSYDSLIVGQAWSTCYELYFYFLMTLLLLFRQPKIRILPTIGFLFIIGFVLLRVTARDGIWGFVNSLAGSVHVLFFCEGIIIAMITKRIMNFHIDKRLLILITLLSLIIYLAVLCTTYSFRISILISPLFFIVIYKTNEVISHDGLFHKMCLELGDASFSIYLIHSVVIKFLLYQCHIDAFLPLLMTTLVSTIALSLVSYHLVEKRFVAIGKNISTKFS